MIIDRRYCGPPESGNGGYVAGRLAPYVGGPGVAVRLRVPPPLERPLDVRTSKQGAGLFDGDLLVAEARPSVVKADVPAPPSFEQSECASSRFRGYHSHWFPSCFVCGPRADLNDGLRIFPGPVEGTELVAAPWIPDASLVFDDGTVKPEFLWAALDCSGAFAFPEPDNGAVLLGELRVHLFGTVSANERCVVVGWQLAHEGRKHHTATALFAESGSCSGVGLATWFEVARGTPKAAS